MSVDRMDRVNELLRREVGDVLFRILRGKDIDISAVTVTRVITSRNLRHAKVMISIREGGEKSSSIMSDIKRERKSIQSQINRDLALKYTPRLTFEQDTSVAQGDRVLDILSHLDEQPADEEGPGVEEEPDDQ